MILLMRCGPFFNRYPDDKYDRFWTGQSGSGLVNLSSSSVLDSGYAVDKPPAAVMNTAVTVLPTDGNIWYTLTPTKGHTNPLQINLFFAELNV